MFVAVRIGKRRGAPLFDTAFHEPEFNQIDTPLVVGAALFGVGWGMSGICPGPAISLIAFWPQYLLIYLVALFVGSYGRLIIIPSGREQAAGPRPHDKQQQSGRRRRRPGRARGGGGRRAKAGLETVHLVPQGAAGPAHLGAHAAGGRVSQGCRPGSRSGGDRPSADADPDHRCDPPADPRTRDAVRQRRVRDLPAFGWNFAQRQTGRELSRRRGPRSAISRRSRRRSHDLEIGADGTTLRLANGQTLRTDSLVGADGKKSRVRESAGFRARENGFTQAALVCDLGLERPVGGASVEFHYPNGPFTLVPAGGNRANLVWIDERDTLKAAQEGGKEKLAALVPREVAAAVRRRRVADARRICSCCRR